MSDVVEKLKSLDLTLVVLTLFVWRISSSLSSIAFRLEQLVDLTKKQGSDGD